MESCTKEKENLNEEVIFKAYSKNDRYSGYAEEEKNPATMFDLTKYGKTYAYIRTHVDTEDKTTTLIRGTGSNYKSKTVVINEHNASFALDTNIKNAIMNQAGYNKIIVPQDQAFKKAQAYQTSIQEIGAKATTLKAIAELANAIKG